MNKVTLTIAAALLASQSCAQIDESGSSVSRALKSINAFSRRRELSDHEEADIDEEPNQKQQQQDDQGKDDANDQSNKKPVQLNGCPKEEVKEPEPVGALQYIVIVVLALMSGAFSGLNLGLLGLDVKNLELLCKPPVEGWDSPGVTEEQRKEATWAAKILPLRRKGNYLLCTILLGNVSVNSGLSILMGDLTSGIMGLIVSTAIITIFGEIIPQAGCSRYALFVGAHSTWFIYIFMFLTFPISFPFSAILDKVLGEEVGNTMQKNQLKQMFQMMEEEGHLQKQEKKIMQAALKLQESTVSTITTPLAQVYMLEVNRKLDKNLMREIYEKGYSRIPVYKNDRENIIGCLLARDLILLNTEKKELTLKQLSSILFHDIVLVDHADKLEPIFGFFKRGMTHIAVVTKTKTVGNRDPVREVCGIITMEDIIEQIIDDDIEDETRALEEKEYKKQQVQKLALLFTDTTGEYQLELHHINAIKDFLHTNVRPFKLNLISKDKLHILIQRSEVLDFKADEKIFSTNLSQMEDQMSGSNQMKKSTMSQTFDMHRKQLTQAKNQVVSKLSDIAEQAKEKEEEEYQPQLLLKSGIGRFDQGKEDPQDKSNLLNHDQIKVDMQGASTEMMIVKNNLKEQEDFEITELIPEEGAVNKDDSSMFGNLTGKVRGSDDKVSYLTSQMDAEAKINGGSPANSSSGRKESQINTQGLMKLKELQQSSKIIDKKTEIMLKYDGEDYISNGIDVLNNDEINQLVNPILYTRGVASPFFYLVLRGKVMVVSGQEGFQVELSEFSTMGIDALERDDYIPDFSAKVIGQARVLQITRENYRKLTSGIQR